MLYLFHRQSNSEQQIKKKTVLASLLNILIFAEAARNDKMCVTLIMYIYTGFDYNFTVGVTHS